VSSSNTSGHSFDADDESSTLSLEEHELSQAVGGPLEVISDQEGNWASPDDMGEGVIPFDGLIPRVVYRERRASFISVESSDDHDTLEYPEASTNY